MNRTVTIVTPENITVTYQAAGFASRFVAFLIDFVIQIVLCLAALLFFRLAASGFLWGSLSPGDFFNGAFYIAIFVILYVYPFIFEMAWGGRTPGKRLLKLRVIRDGGYPINFTSSAIRNILRFLDFGFVPISPPLVLCGFPGIVCIFLSKEYKRLGDWAAGTLVIVEAGISPFNPLRSQTTLAPQAAELLPQIKNVDRLSVEEYRAVRRFVERRGTWDPAVQAALAESLARPLLEKLEIQPNIAYQLQYGDWLEAIERLYTEEQNLL